MRYRCALIACVLPLAAAGGAQDHDHGRMTSEPNGPVIDLVVNPEARVSAALAKSPPPARCDRPVPISLKVVNQGYVTAVLRAEIVGSGAKRAVLHMDSKALTGAPVELRTLQLIATAPGTTDVTIAFSISQELGDLGGRDRVSIVLNCAVDAVKIGLRRLRHKNHRPADARLYP